VGLVRLEWVLLDGRPAFVSTFAALGAGRRPSVLCPECRQPVTLKLGSERRHHAAHRPGDACAATHPETALHLNVKCHIAAVLEGAIGGTRPLMVRRRCAAECGRWIDTVWVPAWDAIRLESSLRQAETRRVPDIVLEKDGVTIGAIEILVSHAVDDEKAAALAALRVPWLEVRADEGLIESPGWSIDLPLMVHRASGLGDWRCENDQLLYATVSERQRHDQVREAEALRHTTVIAAARVVDIYRPGGWSARLVYSVVESSTDGRLTTVTLMRDGFAVESYRKDEDAPGAFRARISPLIKRAYDADVVALRRPRGAITDSPMRWARGAAAAILSGSPAKHPRRYQFVTRTQRWTMHDDERRGRWDAPPASSRAAVDRALAKVEQAIVRKSRSPQTALRRR
jgi:competence protein CoiA-like protein